MLDDYTFSWLESGLGYKSLELIFFLIQRLAFHMRKRKHLKDGASHQKATTQEQW